MNKIVAFLQQPLLNVTGMCPNCVFAVALAVRIRIVGEERSRQTQIPFVLMGTGQNFKSLAQPANKLENYNMNIKSLLIGSAAALVAVSGARAADAVVAEPEAVEYVRVCDAYGAGYFYIPGTETCLKIGGYVRYDIYGGDFFGDRFQKLARFQLNTSTAAETDYGTLRTFTETRFNWAGGSTGVSLNFAYIELGGLRVGKDESVFTTFAGYAGNVIADDLVGYGPFDTTLISYTFTSGAFSGIISLEDDLGGGSGYVPDVVAGAKYSAGDFSVTGVIGYDESSEEIAAKLRVDAKVGAVSLFIMGGYGTETEVGEADVAHYKPWGGKWAVWGGASVDVSEKATLNLQASYSDENDANLRNFAVNANVKYTVAPGFAITPEVFYEDGKGVSGSFGGILRFQRSF
jgi:opacity protein-like surface antigen